jgi:YaiO family outer membrane protein
MGWVRACMVLGWLTVVSPTTLASAQERAPEAVLADAREAFNAGRTDEATRLLEARLAAAPRDVDARLLYGLVLSWSGRYDEARQQLTAVLDQAPGYLDARIALANVEWWSGRYDALATVAADGRRLAPDDVQWLVFQARAEEGLGQARAARRTIDLALARQPGHVAARALGERLDATLRPWSIALTETVDWFDDDRDTWTETQATIGRLTPAGTLLVRTSRAERFGFTDTQLEVEAYPRFRPGTYGYVNFGVSLDNTLYPRQRAGAELYHAFGRGIEASLGWRRLAFASVTNIYVGTLTKYAGHWMLTGRLYFVPGEPADARSYHAVVRRYFGADGTSFIGAGYSRGLSREEVRNLGDLIPLDSDTVRAEFDARLGSWLRAAASGATSRQERVFGPLRQHTLSASLQVVF